MIIYHEVLTDKLDQALHSGLLRHAHGAKSDQINLKTDEVLDRFIPKRLRDAGISRKDVIYAYIGDEKSIIDITTGESLPLSTYMLKDDRTTLLELHIDFAVCYVSDLELYDRVKSYIADNSRPPQALINSYWRSVVPLADYTQTIRRPELMITRDVQADEIAVLK